MFEEEDAENIGIYDKLCNDEHGGKDDDDVISFHEQDNDNAPLKIGVYKLKYPVSNNERSVHVMFIRKKREVNVLFKVWMRSTKVLAYINTLPVIKDLLAIGRSDDLINKMIVTKYEDRHHKVTLPEDLVDHFRLRVE